MTSSNRFPTLLSLCAGKPQVSGFSSQWDSNANLWCFFVSLKKTVEQTLDWPAFRDAMTVIWRRRNVLNSQYGGCWWPDAYLVPRHLKPSWRNRTVAYLSSCIFFIKIAPWYQLLCGSGNVTQCKRLHFCFFCDCIGVLFVMPVMQSIPAWCYFCEAS